MESGKKCLLFDLGGVLVELSGQAEFRKWLNNRMSHENFERLWLASRSVRLYESGRIGSKEFASILVRELELNASPEEFLEAFSRFPIGLFDGAEELLESLSERYDTACLSNTNEIHWAWMSANTRLEKLLGKCLLSFKTGLMKPDREAFLHAAGELSRDPGDIYFFDDNIVNVDAANQAGFHAFQVRGVAGLKEKLFELGLI